MRRTFKIHRCIGKGGFGEVYEATVHVDGEAPRPVALKMLHADVDPECDAVERLRDESRMLRAIRHPNVVEADTLTVIDGRVALVTELVTGLDLFHLARKNPLPDGVVLAIAAAIADALWAAQTTEVDGSPLDLVHRDIKPQNIRIATDGAIKLLDFGVARTDQIEREALTGDDTLLGSIHYLAPETVETARSSHASDVYALGASLFYASTGRRLFRERGKDVVAALFDRGLFESTVRKRLVHIRDAGIRTLVAKMLQRSPTLRPTHEEVRDEARSLLAAHGDDPLHTFVATYEWPELDPIPGSLSGRVFEEETTEPEAVVPLAPMRAWEPDDQEATQLDVWSSINPEAATDRDLPRESTDAALADPPAEPPEEEPESRPRRAPGTAENRWHTGDPTARLEEENEATAPTADPEATTLPATNDPQQEWLPSAVPTVPLAPAAAGATTAKLPVPGLANTPAPGAPPRSRTLDPDADATGVPMPMVLALVAVALLTGLTLGATVVAYVLVAR